MQTGRGVPRVSEPTGQQAGTLRWSASEIGRSKLPLRLFAREQRYLALFLLIMRAQYLHTCHSALSSCRIP